MWGRTAQTALNSTLNSTMKPPLLTSLISLAIVVLYFACGAMPAELIWVSDEQLERPWSMLSAHFVHLSTEHLAWNLVPFMILGACIEAHSRKRLLLALYAGTLSVWVYLALLSPLVGYAGLSGVLNTLLVVALYEVQKQRVYRGTAYLTLVLSLAKIIFELITHDGIFTSLVWPPVPYAHLAGWIGGLLLALYLTTFIDGPAKYRQTAAKRFNITAPIS